MVLRKEVQRLKDLQSMSRETSLLAEVKVLRNRLAQSKSDAEKDKLIEVFDFDF